MTTFRAVQGVGARCGRDDVVTRAKGGNGADTTHVAARLTAAAPRPQPLRPPRLPSPVSVLKLGSLALHL